MNLVVKMPNSTDGGYHPLQSKSHAPNAFRVLRPLPYLTCPVQIRWNKSYVQRLLKCSPRLLGQKTD